VQRERLDQVGRRIDGALLIAGRDDPHEDDRTSKLAQPSCCEQSGAVADLDHPSVEIGRVILAVPQDDGLVTEPPDDEIQQRPEIGMRLDDEDARHQGRTLLLFRSNDGAEEV
jgi:hypothetical protein